MTSKTKLTHQAAETRHNNGALQTRDNRNKITIYYTIRYLIKLRLNKKLIIFF